MGAGSPAGLCAQATAPKDLVGERPGPALRIDQIGVEGAHSRTTPTNVRVDHIISKKIVTAAERTGRGIALEDLTGIRDRVRLRKDQRTPLHAWSFRQLSTFIDYEARRAGVPVVYVDPAYTSRQCSQCGYTDRKNRVAQATFACRACGVTMHADDNASHNIDRKGETVWTTGRESRVPATP